VGYSVTSRGGCSAVSAPVAIEEVNDPAKLRDLARPMARGDENAPITIVEFADFQCPYCAEYERSVAPQIDAEFIRTGRAKFLFSDFPLVSIHPNAFLAARARAVRRGSGQVLAVSRPALRDQGRWSSLTDPSSTFEGLRDQLGLDEDDYTRVCGATATPTR
jgi:protein-disulfide isomerase